MGAQKIEGVIGELSHILTPTSKRGIITDVATSLQQVIDGIDHVLHPDATVTKRDLVDIAHKIEGVIGELSNILTPTSKRGVIADLANQIQGVIDGIDHVLHPDATVTKRNLVDIAGQIEAVIGEITKVLGPGASAKRNLVDIAHQIEGIIGEI